MRVWEPGESRRRAVTEFSGGDLAAVAVETGGLDNWRSGDAKWKKGRKRIWTWLGVREGFPCFFFLNKGKDPEGP